MRTDTRFSFRRVLGLAGALAALTLVTGCADMKDQPRFRPLRGSEFFADGRSARPLVEGTVARGFLREDDRVYRGLDPDGTFVDRIPMAVDAATVERGQDRYGVFCAPCHSSLGDGMGMIVQRGYKQAASYHTDRLRTIEDGYFYDVITNGFGQMAGYASQVRPEDRWAIVAYIRALQLATHSDVATVPAEVRRALARGESVDTRPQPAPDSHHGQEEDHGSEH